jgi:hypothetical protein
MNEDETVTARGGRATSWPPYEWIPQAEISYSIFDDFWSAKYDERDKQNYARFIRILELSKQGFSGTAIEKLLGANNVRKYMLGKTRSFLTHLRSEYDRLGPPRPDAKWLPLRLKPRGTPDTSWIQVPAIVNNFNDIISVIDQCTPTPQSFDMMTEFGYSSKEELLSDKVNMFGFALGVMLGDAGKHIKGQSRFPSRAFSLTLSKGKPNSYRFGQYTSLCLNASLGIAMHRIADSPSSSGRYSTEECYQWLSPASPIIGWMFHGCMGYQGEETTTYNPARMEWIATAPREPQVRFLQGMSESDGWIDSGDDRAKFVSSPNESLFKAMLEHLKVPYRLCKQPPITRIEIPTENAIALPIFSPRIHSNNYENLLIMANAKSFQPRIRLPEPFLTQIRPILKRDLRYSEICLEIARATNRKITSQTVKKYKNIDPTRIPPPPSFFSYFSQLGLATRFGDSARV